MTAKVFNDGKEVMHMVRHTPKQTSDDETHVAAELTPTESRQASPQAMTFRVLIASIALALLVGLVVAAAYQMQ